MGHADISTMMICVHHVPQLDAAESPSALVANASGTPVEPSMPEHARQRLASVVTCFAAPSSLTSLNGDDCDDKRDERICPPEPEECICA